MVTSISVRKVILAQLLTFPGVGSTCGSMAVHYHHPHHQKSHIVYYTQCAQHSPSRPTLTHSLIVYTLFPFSGCGLDFYNFTQTYEYSGLHAEAICLDRDTSGWAHMQRYVYALTEIYTLFKVVGLICRSRFMSSRDTCSAINNCCINHKERITAWRM